MRPVGTSDWKVSEQAARLVKKFAQSRIALNVAASRFDSLRDYYAAHADYCAELRNLLGYIGALESILAVYLAASHEPTAQQRLWLTGHPDGSEENRIVARKGLTVVQNFAQPVGRVDASVRKVGR